MSTKQLELQADLGDEGKVPANVGVAVLHYQEPKAIPDFDCYGC